MLELPATWSDEIDEVAEWVLDARELVRRIRANIETTRKESELLSDIETYTSDAWLDNGKELKEIRREYGGRRRVVGDLREELKQDLRKAEKWLLISEALLVSRCGVITRKEEKTES